MSKHTTGPWTVVEADSGGEKVIADSADICLIDSFADESEANARLIAAAPEMLETLHGVRLYLAGCKLTSPAPESDQKAIDELTRIINKAEGR